MTVQTSVEDTDLLDISDLEHILRVASDTIRRWAKTGQFPPPDVRLGKGGRWLRWRRGTVLAWLGEQEVRGQ